MDTTRAGGPKMKRKLFKLFVAAPLALILITLAVANRHDVQLVLDPTAPQETAFSLVVPLYMYLFGAMFVGILIGGISTWLSQARWRMTARKRTREGEKWRKEADRLARQVEVLTKSAAAAAPAPAPRLRDKVALPSPKSDLPSLAAE